MSALGRLGLGNSLTLGLCLLALSCGSPQAPAALGPLVGPAAGPNLLRNGGFLLDASAWQATPAAAVLGHDQAGFLTVVVPPSGGPQTAGWSQTVAVEPDTSYHFSYRVHTEELSGYAGLRLGFFDAGGQLLWETGSVPAFGDTPWTAYSWRCRAPLRAAQARITLGVEAATAGRAAFDEAYLGPDDAPTVRALIVDYAQESRPLRTFRQANAGSLGPQPAAGASLLGAQCLRTSLSGPAGLRAIFPDPLANPDDPAAYDFEATDATLTPMVEGGAQVFFQLGDGEGSASSGSLPPNRWAEVAKHIAMHYNDGWARGYHYGIRYWEVCAGPDRPDSWQGPGESYYRILAATIAVLKAYDPQLQVGGPALTTPACLPHLEGLLGYLAERGLRLDFLSWHSTYDGSPRAGAVAEAALERLLDRYGFADSAVILSDWGPPANAGPAPAGAYWAAHLAASVSYWQDTRLAQAYRSWPSAAPGLALLDAQGGLTTAGQAYRLLGLLDRTPRRLLTQGGDELGFTLLAGKSDDGNLVQIVIADTGSRSEEYRLALAGFPPGYQYAVSDLSQEGQAEVLAAGSAADLPTGVLILPWRSPAAHFIQVWWEQKEPEPQRALLARQQP